MCEGDGVRRDASGEEGAGEEAADRTEDSAGTGTGRGRHPNRVIGLISDTHGLLRREAIDALGGSDLILHAGDVGDPGILDDLRRVAPVVAVHGNTDRGELRRALPETAVVGLASHPGQIDPGEPLAYLLHELERLDLDAEAAGVSVVIYGHTHRPALYRRGGVLYVNPGAAGHRRFDLPITVGRLNCGEDGVRAEIVELDVGS